MGDAYGLGLLIVYGGYTAIIACVAVLGVIFWARGRRTIGAAIVSALVLWCIAPPIYDRVRAISEHKAVEAANLLPSELSFAGQDVLIIEAGNTICGDFCGDVVGLSVPGNFYWVGIGHFTGAEDVPNPDFPLLNHGDEIVAVRLGPAVADLGGQRCAEPVEGADIPRFDVVIIDDDGYLRGDAPGLLGLPEALVGRAQVARVLIEGWGDPFTEPPPAPTYRSVAVWRDVGDFIYWPLSRNHDAYPSLSDLDAAWYSALCAAAGPEADRVAFTHAFRCDPDRAGAALN